LSFFASSFDFAFESDGSSFFSSVFAGSAGFGSAAFSCFSFSAASFSAALPLRIS
jgi:hypothetical protein